MAGGHCDDAATQSWMSRIAQSRYHLGIDRPRIFLYGILPATVTFGLIACYFAPADWARQLAAPHPNREFGLIENIQNVILLAMAVLCVRAGQRETARRARFAWWAVGLFATLVLLEELDYGAHWYRVWNDIRYDPHDNVNIHNRGRLTKRIMIVVDTATVAAFAIAPFLVRFIPQRIRPFVPSPYSVMTLLVLVVTGPLAKGMAKSGWEHSGSLAGNFSEFREGVTYWLAFLYLREVSLRRTEQPAPAS